jgi:hypothetical protein
VKIRMLVAMSGTRNGARWPALGETATLPDTEAARLVASGLAEEVATAAPVETATVPPAEVTTPPAAKPPSRRRGRTGKGESAKE